MVIKYNTVTETVTAIQFTFDVLKDVYTFLSMKDINYSIKNRTLSGIVTGLNGEKLSVQKNDFIVKDSGGNITIWKPIDFNKKFTKVES